jgi:alpha-tubulin suppressor-like RCC1 family protein
MPTFNFKDNDGIDIGDKYVTKEYVMDAYPDLVPGFTSGELFTWGSNSSGELGTNNTTSRSSPGTTVGSSAAWNQVALGGASFSAGIKTDGTLWTWGSNAYGCLGIGTEVARSSPGTTAGGGTNWKQVATGAAMFAAIKTDGTLWTCGYNLYGQLGNSVSSFGNFRSSPGTTSGAGTNWKQVSALGSRVGAVKSDGTLWMWGYAGNGELGDGTTTNKSSPVTVSGGGTNWKQVSVGSGSAAVKTDGTLWTWGGNGSGENGSNNLTARSSPGQTSGGGTNWKSVSAGSSGTCAAIKTDGTLWTWGANSVGQLGTGDTTDRSSPGTTVGGGTNWKTLSGEHSNNVGAIKTDGTLWTWGYNNAGQLGNGINTTNRSSPGTTAGGKTNWKQISCTYARAAAISDQGEL